MYASPVVATRNEKEKYISTKRPSKSSVSVVYSLGINIKSIHSSVQILPSLAMLIHTHTSLSAAVEHCIFTKNPTLCFFALNIYVSLFRVNIINICKASYCFQYKFLYIYIVLLFFFQSSRLIIFSTSSTRLICISFWFCM